MEIEVTQKDDLVMKIIHYFITKEDYKPIVLRGADNEIWLENFDKDIEIVRINTKYIHNTEQLKRDIFRTNLIRKDISKKTLSFNTKLLNILVDTAEDIKICENKNIHTTIVKKIDDIKVDSLINSYFPSLKDNIYSNVGDALEFFKINEELSKKSKKDEKKLNKIFKPKMPVVTYTIMSINILIFFLMFIPKLYTLFIYYGANNPKLINSEGVLGLYRLFTSSFLHSGFVHLAFNMYALYIVGEKVETYYGKTRYLIIYLLSAFVGSLFSNVFLPSSDISIGASGAIFGLFGSLLYFSYNYRSTVGMFLKSSLIPTILLNLALGFIVPGIDIYGHIGGLIAGVFTSVILNCPGKKKNKVTVINSSIVLVLLIIFMLIMLFRR